MIVYWILLLVTAFAAYFIGSMSTLVIASNFIFRRNLARLGEGGVWLSNFRRVYGVWGFVKLLLTELVKDLLPILLGGLLLGIKGHAEVGRAFAGFCLVLGRLYPAIYDFRRSHATVCLIVSALLLDSSMGIAIAALVAAVGWFTRYLSLATMVGALVMVIASLLLIDDNLTMTLALFTAGLVLIRHIPSISRLLNGREEKLSFEEDITYKFDEKF